MVIGSQSDRHVGVSCKSPIYSIIWFTGFVRSSSRGNLALLPMDERGNLVALEGLWTKVFQIASRRDVIAASVVGLCGLGCFLGARRFLALTPAERRLLRESGSDPFCHEESTDRRRI